MAEDNLCPRCHSPLPPESPKGTCPKCLLKQGLARDTIGFTAEDQPHARWTPPPVEQLAPLFPELDIIELIGRGGMGAVYKAREKQLDRLVALKILPPEIGREEAFAQRFAREAQAMAKLSHHNIVTIYSFGQRERLFFFIMEYVDGLSLRQVLDRGAACGERGRSVSPKEALAIVPQICDALQYAHDRGIVHRDIKPENILLNRSGQVKIADFGLAKLVGQSVTNMVGPASGGAGPTSTLVGERVCGTPQYMAPEQIDRPSEVDHRADIYSLGVVFYQMLTGELPAGPEEFGPPSHKVLIDVRLDEVVLRALEREPARRYQQVSEVRTRVETIVGTPDGTDIPGTATRPAVAGSPAAQPQGPEEAPPSPQLWKWLGSKLIPVRPWHKRVVVVGVRGGKRVVNWPAALNWFALAILLAFYGFIIRDIRGFAGSDTGLLGAVLIGLGVGLFVGVMLGIAMLNYWAIERLVPLDPQPNQKDPPLSPEQMETARWPVRAPAIGLLVAAGVNVAVITIWATIGVIHGLVVPAIGTSPYLKPVSVASSVVVAACIVRFITWSAYGMMQLKRRGCAIAASILTMIGLPATAYGMFLTHWINVDTRLLAALVVPSVIVGLPVGIWALVVLCRREVRDAFAAVAAQPRAPATAKRHRWRKRAIALAIAALIVGLAGTFVLQFYHVRADESKAEADRGSLELKLGPLIREWKETQPRTQEDLANYEVQLVIDASRRVVELRQQGVVQSQVTLPDGYRWTVLYATPAGNKELEGPVTLSIPGLKGSVNMPVEAFVVIGDMGDGKTGVHFDISSTGQSIGTWGVGLGVLKTFTIKPVGEITGTVNRSLLVSSTHPSSASVAEQWGPAEDGVAIRLDTRATRWRIHPYVGPTMAYDVRNTGRDTWSLLSAGLVGEPATTATVLGGRMVPPPGEVNIGPDTTVGSVSLEFQKAWPSWRKSPGKRRVWALCRLRSDHGKDLLLLSNAAEIEILPADVSATQPATQPAAGPVIERIVHDLDEGRGKEALGLDSGSQLDLPPNFGRMSVRQRKAWLEDNGVDLLADHAQNRWALMAEGLQLAAMAPQQWQTANLDAVRTVLASETPGVEVLKTRDSMFYLLPKDAKPPLVFAFRTRHDGIGVLQITSFADRPHSLNIRYRLLSEATAPAPSTGSGPSTQGEAARTRLEIAARTLAVEEQELKLLGQRVAKGLASNTELGAQELKVQEAKTRLIELTQGEGSKAAVEARLALAERAVAVEEQELNRLRQLVAKGLASQKEFLEQELEVLRAKARLAEVAKPLATAPAPSTGSAPGTQPAGNGK